MKTLFRISKSAVLIGSFPKLYDELHGSRVVSDRWSLYVVEAGIRFKHRAAINQLSSELKKNYDDYIK